MEKVKVETPDEKIRVDQLDMIVTGTFEKPYYQLMYHEVGSKHTHVGFGSYYICNVFEWREKYFIMDDGSTQFKADCLKDAITKFFKALVRRHG